MAFPALGSLVLAGASCITASEGTWFIVKSITIPVVLAISIFFLYLTIKLSNTKEKDKKSFLYGFIILIILFSLIPFAKPDTFSAFPFTELDASRNYDIALGFLWILCMFLYIWPGAVLAKRVEADESSLLTIIGFTISMLSLIAYIIALIFNIGFLFWSLPVFFVGIAALYFDQSI
jgi:hypothetical protein